MTHSQPPGWLETLGWVSLALAFATGLAIVYDILVRGHRQRMAVMNVVYPVTALYWGPVALWFYLRHGRRMSKKVGGSDGGNDSGDGPVNGGR